MIEKISAVVSLIDARVTVFNNFPLFLQITLPSILSMSLLHRNRFRRSIKKPELQKMLLDILNALSTWRSYIYNKTYKNSIAVSPFEQIQITI